MGKIQLRHIVAAGLITVAEKSSVPSICPRSITGTPTIPIRTTRTKKPHLHVASEVSIDPITEVTPGGFEPPLLE